MTKVIDSTAANDPEFGVGMEGYFWDEESSGEVSKGALTKIDKNNAFPFERNNSESWNHFSPSIPEWFLISEPQKKKPIEFVKWLDLSIGTSHRTDVKPTHYDNVKRDVRATGEGYDLMVAWDNANPQIRVGYLGHWNDGIV
jgi:hypothetical protein